MKVGYPEQLVSDCELCPFSHSHGDNNNWCQKLGRAVGIDGIDPECPLADMSK